MFKAGDTTTISAVFIILSSFVFIGILFPSNLWISFGTLNVRNEKSTFKDYQIKRYSQVSKNLTSASGCGYLKGSMKTEVLSVLKGVGDNLVNLYPDDYVL